MEQTQEVAVVPENRHDLTVARNPEQVLAEAQQAAQALKNVVSKKSKPVIFNGEQYLELEDWATVAKFYGSAAKVVSTDYIEFGEARGFKARAVVYHIPTGQEISAAESMCLTDEPNWSKKPMFQLMSMAQTRACGKALRNVFSWVVVLAGYRPTPSEEMNGVFEKTVQTPQAKKADPGTKITEPQRKRFYAIWKASGKTEAEVKQYLKDLVGTDDSSQIPVEAYDSACAWAGTKNPQEA